MAGALRTLCVPSGRRHSAKLLLGRPGRFLSGYPERPPLYLGLRCARAARRAIRADVMRALEAAREARKIGSSLQAHVEVRACGARYQALAGLGDDLKFM